MLSGRLYNTRSTLSRCHDKVGNHGLQFKLAHAFRAVDIRDMYSKDNLHNHDIHQSLVYGRLNIGLQYVICLLRIPIQRESRVVRACALAAHQKPLSYIDTIEHVFASVHKNTNDSVVPLTNQVPAFSYLGTRIKQPERSETTLEVDDDKI